MVRAGRPAFLAHMVDRRADGLALRYDAACMFPGGRVAQAEQALIQGLLSSQQAFQISWHFGDMAIIDNSRFLHGRGPSEVDDSDWVLKRVMIAEDTRDGVGL